MVVEDVSATVLNMAFFDRLEKSGVVREGGRIVKCFDEMCGDMVVSDQLRKVRIGQMVGMASMCDELCLNRCY